MKYYIIGQRELVLAFKMTGVEGTVAETKSEVLEAFNKLTGRGSVTGVPAGEIPRILILSEDASALIQNEVIEWQKTGKFPLVVEIPGLNGHNPNRKSLTDTIREAVGVQI